MYPLNYSGIKGSVENLFYKITNLIKTLNKNAEEKINDLDKKEVGPSPTSFDTPYGLLRTNGGGRPRPRSSRVHRGTPHQDADAGYSGKGKIKRKLSIIAGLALIVTPVLVATYKLHKKTKIIKKKSTIAASILRESTGPIIGATVGAAAVLLTFLGFLISKWRKSVGKPGTDLAEEEEIDDYKVEQIIKKLENNSKIKIANIIDQLLENSTQITIKKLRKTVFDELFYDTDKHKDSELLTAILATDLKKEIEILEKNKKVNEKIDKKITTEEKVENKNIPEIVELLEESKMSNKISNKMSNKKLRKKGYHENDIKNARKQVYQEYKKGILEAIEKGLEIKNAQFLKTWWRYSKEHKLAAEIVAESKKKDEEENIKVSLPDEAFFIEERYNPKLPGTPRRGSLIENTQPRITPEKKRYRPLVRNNTNERLPINELLNQPLKK